MRCVARRKTEVEGEVAGGADPTLSVSFSEGDLYQWVGGLWRAEPGPGLGVVKHVHRREGVDPTFNNPRPWGDGVYEGFATTVGQWIVACGTRSRPGRGGARP